jgi:uncharacterized membrane protein
MVGQRSCWNDPRIISLLLLVFVAGGLVGAIGHTLLVQRSTVAANPANTESMVNRLEKELDLSPEQTEKLVVVLDDFFKYYHALQAQSDEVKGHAKRQITSILTPAQREKFDKMMTEFQQKPRAANR